VVFWSSFYQFFLTSLTDPASRDDGLFTIVPTVEKPPIVGWRYSCAPRSPQRQKANRCGMRRLLINEELPGPKAATNSRKAMGGFDGAVIVAGRSAQAQCAPRGGGQDSLYSSRVLLPARHDGAWSSRPVDDLHVRGFFFDSSQPRPQTHAVRVLTKGSSLAHKLPIPLPPLPR